MFKSRNAKRFRAILIALAITYVTNFAISYAAKQDTILPQTVTGSSRSGVTTSTKPPLPTSLRSGVTTSTKPPLP